MRQALITDLDQIDPTDVATFGGKATNLAQLRGAGGIAVPDGFCVGTTAFAAASHGARSYEEVLAAAVPDDVAAGISAALARFPDTTSFAVRSSAVAEDLPGASFAGLHDSFLDVIGIDAVLEAVQRCWASLFTDRAVAYRRRTGIHQDGPSMAVLVQEMVRADLSGVMFTADPVTGDRRTTVVEAVRGLGEALVSGRRRPDTYRVRGDQVAAIDPPTATTLDRATVGLLSRLGRQVEAVMGRPQDIEWCLRGDVFSIVQTRPITTLFPPPPQDDDAYRVYLSVGHQQMMTDAMTPLGLSCWQMSTPAPMAEAGNRLWVNVTARLAAPATREPLLRMAREHDPLTLDALTSVLEHGRFPAGAQPGLPHSDGTQSGPHDDGAADLPDEPDPARVIGLIDRAEQSIAQAADRLAAASGSEIFDVLREDWQELRRTLFDPEGVQVITAAMSSATWLNDHLARWLDEQSAADLLTRGVDHDPTAEMGLALLDIADLIRPCPDVIRYLSTAHHDDTLLEGLDGLEGGPAVRDALESWLQSYGARCPGEIDISRRRWAEQPTALLPVLLSHVRDVDPEEAARRRVGARRDADAWQQHLIDRLREHPDHQARIAAVQRHIAVVRAYTGYREYPKYAKIRRYWVYKQALLGEISRLVTAGVLRSREDAFYLRFDELEQSSRAGQVEQGLIDRRRAEYAASSALRPPRVLTSDGEALNGTYHRSDAPSDALVGLAASTGTVTGRARVVLEPGSAQLQPGDILVTRFTDPSWTPLFVTAAALVTEIGGLMTHGAVVAREYGLPAVLGVTGATERIADGELIRVDGSRGWVERIT